MKSADVAGAACVAGPVMAAGGETDCALATVATSAHRKITRIARFIRRFLQQSWMKDQSNRFLGDSLRHASGISKTRDRFYAVAARVACGRINKPSTVRVFARKGLQRFDDTPRGTRERKYSSSIQR